MRFRILSRIFVQSVIGAISFFCCFRFQFPAAPVPAPFLLSSGRVQPLAEGYVVRLLDKDGYRIKRINPATQTVVLQKINSSNRCFARPATEIWLPPPSSNSLSVEVDCPPPPAICDCSPVPPKLIVDTCDVAVDASLDADDSMELLVSEFFSVGELNKGFEEARAAANKARIECGHTFDLLCEEMTLRKAKEKEIHTAKLELAGLQINIASQVVALAEKDSEIAALKTRLSALSDENSSLLQHSLQQSEELSNLKLAANRVSDAHLTTEMLIHQLSTYAIDLDFNDDNLFFDVLGLTPTSDVTKINIHARHLLRLVHPDKNPSIPADVAQLIPCLKEAKSILTDPQLNKIYQCCGMSGVRRARRKLRTCMDCDSHMSDWFE